MIGWLNILVPGLKYGSESEIQKWNAEWTFADRRSTSREIWEVDIKVRSFVVGSYGVEAVSNKPDAPTTGLTKNIHSNFDLDMSNLLTEGLDFVHSIDPRPTVKSPIAILYTVHSNITAVSPPLISLTLRGHLLLALPHLFLLFLLEVLLLSFGIKSLQLEISLQLLCLLTFQASLLSLLFLISLLQLTDGIFTGGSDFAKDFGPEVGIRDERICQANEILEDWQGLAVVAGGGDSHGEIDALLWNGLLNSGCSVSLASVLSIS
jgi:hypothetical protein